MNWEELRVWVNDPARTRAELQAAASGLTLTTGGNVAQLRNRVLGRIAAEADLTNGSAYTPPGWTAPVVPPPVPPVPPTPPTPPAPTTPAPRARWYQRMFGHEDATPIRTVGIILILAALGFAIWLIDVPTWMGNTIGNQAKSTTSATVTNTTTATASATPKAEVTQATSGDSLPNGNAPSYKEASFRDNRQFVKCESTFTDPTGWLLCEPGVLLNSTATFTRGQVKAIYNMDCPEGGFAYASFAQGRFHFQKADFTVDLPGMGAGTNRLVVTRCPISDGKRDTDLNDTIEIGNFIPGHTIWSEIPPSHPDGSAFISKNWFGQQLVTSFHTGGSNCGSNGCSTLYITLIDVDSQLVETFKVTNIIFQKGSASYNDYVKGTWELINSNRK